MWCVIPNQHTVGQNLTEVRNTYPFKQLYLPSQIQLCPLAQFFLSAFWHTLNWSTLSWEDNKEQLLNLLPGCLGKLPHLSEPFSEKLQASELTVCALIQQEMKTYLPWEPVNKSWRLVPSETHSLNNSNLLRRHHLCYTVRDAYIFLE